LKPVLGLRAGINALFTPLQAASFKEHLMQLISWLSRRMTGRRQTRRAPAPTPAPRFRPQLERLERRDVPSTLTVSNNQDSGAGSLRAEIAAANAGDTIVFAPSLNGTTITLASGELLITRSLTIQGPGASQVTISGGGLFGSRVFEVEGAASNVNLSGLSITQGYGMAGGTAGAQAADGTGGGIYNAGTLTLSGCDLYDCNNYDPQADPQVTNWFGGGIYNRGTLTLNSCQVYDCSSWGGGGGISNAGMLTLSGSTLSGNTAVYGGGGGIANNGTLTLSSSTLSDNTTGSDGGGIYNSGTATVSGCTLTGNTAPYGGAIFNYTISKVSNSGTLTVSSTTLSDDTAGSYGGGIYNSGTATVSSCTVTGCSAAVDGGGIDNDKGGRLTVSDSLFSANLPDNMVGKYTNKGGNTFQ
jgi:hypothetical protein